jgi:ABC-type multidrug transport system fused ATPase/permease subunit
VLHLSGSFAFPGKLEVDAALAPAVSGEPVPLLDSRASLPCALRNVTVDLSSGQLMVVCGRVATGKSALLRALGGTLSPMDRHSKCSRDPTVDVALVPQVAWIRNATLKDNVVFGSVWDPSRYAAVLHACCLDEDIRMLPQGNPARALSCAPVCARGSIGFGVSQATPQRLGLVALTLVAVKSSDCPWPGLCTRPLQSC